MCRVDLKALRVLGRCSLARELCASPLPVLFRFKISSQQAVFELTLAQAGLELFNLPASALKFLTDLEMRG